MTSGTLCQLLDGVTTLFHQPARSARGTTDANRLDAVEPRGFDLMGILDEVGVGIHTQALVEEYLAVGALSATDEKDEVVAGSKLRDIRHAVGNTTADSVERAEGGLGGDVLLDVLDDAVVLVERLCGLGVEIDVAREIKAFHLVEVLDDDGVRLCLSDQSQHLGMSPLAEDHYL